MHIDRKDIRALIKTFKNLQCNYETTLQGDSPTDQAWADGKADAYRYAAMYLKTLLQNADTAPEKKEQS